VIFFRRKIWRKIGVFLLKIPLVYEKIDLDIGFLEKNTIFSPKIVIITSTPVYKKNDFLSHDTILGCQTQFYGKASNFDHSTQLGRFV
jgi:hypothetical protein